jgi:hypothetical protein
MSSVSQLEDHLIPGEGRLLKLRLGIDEFDSADVYRG